MTARVRDHRKTLSDRGTCFSSSEMRTDKGETMSVLKEHIFLLMMSASFLGHLRQEEEICHIIHSFIHSCDHKANIY